MSYQKREFRYIKGKQEGWNETECADFLGLDEKDKNKIIKNLYDTKYRGRTPNPQTLKERVLHYCKEEVKDAMRQKSIDEGSATESKEESAAKASAEATREAKRKEMQAAQKKAADKKVKLKEDLGAFLENPSVGQFIDKINEFDINYEPPEKSNPTLELNRSNCEKLMGYLKVDFVNELTKLIFNDYKSGKINKEHAIKLLVDVIDRANKDAHQIREECLTAMSETLYFQNINRSLYGNEIARREAEAKAEAEAMRQAREAEAMRQAIEATREVTKKPPGGIDLEGLKLIDDDLTRRLYKIKGNLDHDEFDLGKFPDGTYILTDRKNKSVQVLKGGKRKTQKRKTQKRKTQKRKTQKRKTQKRKTQKRKTQKRKTQKRKTQKRKTHMRKRKTRKH